MASAAAILLAAEFAADKVRWLDSLGDAVHTVIRPLGAALLALAMCRRWPACHVMAICAERCPRRKMATNLSDSLEDERSPECCR
jgi:hypothetical protein